MVRHVYCVTSPEDAIQQNESPKVVLSENNTLLSYNGGYENV